MKHDEDDKDVKKEEFDLEEDLEEDLDEEINLDELMAELEEMSYDEDEKSEGMTYDEDDDMKEGRKDDDDMKEGKKDEDDNKVKEELGEVDLSGSVEAVEPLVAALSFLAGSVGIPAAAYLASGGQVNLSKLKSLVSSKFGSKAVAAGEKAAQSA